ncbi:MAG TPA: hypothetical protein VHT27_00150 [Solirubrobacteraceae bacterium]|jgi:hypothetical protein|nr:hypothetical protein [Solirubrobacteraceae bacterium]
MRAPEGSPEPPPAEVAPGLWHWAAPHPEWRSGADPGSASDWPQRVGCVLYELPEVSVLFDPQLPQAGRERFLAWLDARLRGRQVSILTTIRWHRRDRAQLAERYAEGRAHVWNWQPPGVIHHTLPGAGETLYWLPGAAALVAGDRLVTGPGGRLAVCPESWLANEHVDRRGLAELLRPLLGLPVERVLVSHGEPVLADGLAALARAIAEAE